jgi:hypothetical protein
MRKTLILILILACLPMVARADSWVTKINGGGYLTVDSVYVIGWGLQVDGDSSEVNLTQIWVDSLWGMIYSMIDTTASKIPTATLADTTVGGAARATIAADVDTGGTKIAAALADRVSFGDMSDTTWMALDAAGDTARAVDKLHPHVASVPVDNIDDTYDRVLFKLPYAITIDSVFGLCDDGTNVVGALDEYDYAGTSVDAVVDADWTITTSQYVDGSFTNAGLDAGDWLGWHTTSVSGTVTHFTLTIWFHEN